MSQVILKGDWRVVNNGVPQRSVLELVLFNICISDLGAEAGIVLTELADDTKVGILLMQKRTKLLYRKIKIIL